MEAAVRHVCPFWLASQREDLVQTALFKLIRRDRERGAPGEFNATYLHRMAYSLLVDELRRRQRRGETPLDDEHEHPSSVPTSDAPDPEHRLRSKQLGNAIWECLEALIGPRRRAVTLKLLGHPNREIGALLQWAPKRVENLVSRGRGDLRECLEKKGFTP